MSEPDLKPCQFCGGNLVGVTVGTIESPVEYEAFGRCSDCDAQGPGAYFHETSEEAEQEAARLWNTRAPSPEAEALAEAVRTIREASQFHSQPGVADHVMRYAHESTMRLCDATLATYHKKGKK